MSRLEQDVPRSEAAKRRAKKARAAVAGLPGLAEVPKKQPNGRTRRAGPSRKAKEDLLPRLVRYGGVEDAATLRIMAGPHMGHDMGFILQWAYGGDKDGRHTIDKLWQVFRDWLAAEETYRRRYLGQSGNPKGAAIAMMPDRFEASADDAPQDLRSDEERDRDAVSGWMRWQGYLGHLRADQAQALNDARKGERAIWQEAFCECCNGHSVVKGPTPLGREALVALAALHKVVDKR